MQISPIAPYWLGSPPPLPMHWDWLIAVSANAIACVWDYLPALLQTPSTQANHPFSSSAPLSPTTPWPEERFTRPRVALMGASMAEKVAHRFTDWIMPEQGNDSAALLAHPHFQASSLSHHPSVLLVAGDEWTNPSADPKQHSTDHQAGKNLGQRQLTTTLTERGARVWPLIAYHRTIHTAAIADLLATPSSAWSTAIVVTNAAVLQAVVSAEGTSLVPSSAALLAHCQAIPLFTQHWRIRDHALKLGFRSVTCVPRLTDLPDAVLAQIGVRQ